MFYCTQYRVRSRFDLKRKKINPLSFPPFQLFFRSCPFRLFNTSTSTWLHLVAQNNRKVAIEDAILNKVGKTEQDSRIRFQSKLDISDLSNVLLMYKVNEDTMRKLAYVSSFRDPLKCILESSNVMEGLVAKKTLSISSETQHRIFTIVRDIVFFCTESQDTNFATRVGIPIASHQEMIRQSGLLDLLLEFLSFEAQLELAEFKNTRMVFQYIYRLLMSKSL